MSERWKYQIKTGGIWGLFMVVFNILFELKEKPFMEQISSSIFYIKAVVYIAVGIFILGYFNWKRSPKNQQ
jgi:hypothetical protein